MISEVAKFFVYLGLTFLVLGLSMLLFSKIPNPDIPFGKLPGDIYIKRENFVFYFPITTGILISLFLSMIFYFLNFLSKGK